jgi:hypothetical protein
MSWEMEVTMGNMEHMGQAAVEVIEDMRPLEGRKSPAAAFLLGFFTGAFGVAIYFKSAKDFFVCMGMFIAFLLIAPWGPGELAGMCFAACYGAWRAHSSNQKLGL